MPDLHSYGGIIPGKNKAPLRGFVRLVLPFFICSYIWSAPVIAGDLPSVAAIASAHPLATQAGHFILSQGGNAFDAAVAVASTLAVVEPYSSGLGGGGFWLLHKADDGYETMLDARERAPLAATRDMYLDADGEVIPGLSIDGPLSAGIPGVPAALVHLSEYYGALSLGESLVPAIAVAEQGFPVDEYYLRMARFRLASLAASASSAQVFLDDGVLPEVGHIVRQPDLGRTLRLIAKRGNAGFYDGEVANKLVDGVRKAGGIWTRQDLREYKVIEREVIRGEYRGARIITAAPPSSGGIVLMSILNILSDYDLPKDDPVQRTHLITEAMRHAYRDRALYLGDPDFVSIPVRKLLSEDYAQQKRKGINPKQATASKALDGMDRPEAQDTTHFSVLDKQGNRVSATLSINYPFGSGFMPEGTGVLLNDEMDDFSMKPGVPNVYGLVGGEANAIEPGKRMLSSMTPTMVETDEGVLILGTPGGSRIITMVLHGILAHLDGKSIENVVSQRRFHHQYLPDHIQYERGALSDTTLVDLRSRGHHLNLQDDFGNMQAVYWDRKKNTVSAASDSRGTGEAVVR